MRLPKNSNPNTPRIGVNCSSDQTVRAKLMPESRATPRPVLTASIFPLPTRRPTPALPFLGVRPIHPANPVQPRPRSLPGEDFLPTLAQPPPTNKTFQTCPWSPNTSISSSSHTSLLPATTVLFRQADPRLENLGSASMGKNETLRKGSRGRGRSVREGGKRKQKRGPEANLRCRSGRHDGSLPGSNPKPLNAPPRPGKFERVRMRQRRAFRDTRERPLAAGGRRGLECVIEAPPLPPPSPNQCQQ